MKDAATATSSMPTSVFSRPCKVHHRHVQLRRRPQELNPPLPCTSLFSDPLFTTTLPAPFCPLRCIDPKPPARELPPSTGPAPQRSGLPARPSDEPLPTNLECVIVQKLHRSRRPRRSTELNYIGLGQRMSSFEQSIVCRRSRSSLTRFHPASVATYSRYMIILMDSWSILPKQRGCFYFNRF